jgi:DNA-binding ferritin-like protein
LPSVPLALGTWHHRSSQTHAKAYVARWLLEAHELVLKEVREAAKQAAEAGDDGTKGLLVSGVSRTHEMQVWFLVEYLVDPPLVRAQ